VDEISNPLLIAGFGYVGSVIAEQHLAAGGSAIGLAHSAKPDAPCLIHPCDLADATQVSMIAAGINPAPSAIVHCAASGRGGAEDAYRAVYLQGARNLIAAFPGKPILFTSSTGVYPQSDGAVVTELSAAEPTRETARILRQTEDLVLENGGTVLRLAGIYGPNRSVHLKRILNKTATIETDQPGRWLNQIHRDDAASAVLHLLSLNREKIAGEIFNGCDSVPLRQPDAYRQIAKLVDQPEPPLGEAATGTTKRGLTSKFVSNEKLRNTGWQPLYPSFLDAVKNDAEMFASIYARIFNE
jgi:nucleoside-diphosphate-sugar epimerase